MMTLKEFFVAALAEFEADVSLRSANKDWEYLLHTSGICDALAEVARKESIDYHAGPYSSARQLLSTYRPNAQAHAYWFPVNKEVCFELCVPPRRAILNKIIGDL